MVSTNNRSIDLNRPTRLQGFGESRLRQKRQLSVQMLDSDQSTAASSNRSVTPEVVIDVKKMKMAEGNYAIKNSLAPRRGDDSDIDMAEVGCVVASPVKPVDLEIQLKEIYGDDIFNWLRVKEQLTTVKNCLDNHEITAGLRAKMVDWMIEVLTSFKCSEETFFLAVNIMDRYLKKNKERMTARDLHLIGVASMFLATKFEDIYPIRLKEFFVDVGHKRLPKEEIKECEARMFKTLEYNLCTATVLEYIERFVDKFVIAKRAFVKKVALYVAKMTQHDYECSSFVPSLLAVGVISVAFTLIEKFGDKTLIAPEW
eukprot:CAMPEP_0115021702 /NCGR_PEP_ID=MMETSP0216-20121206/31065_1 /TAXON_ID=223996 /ORGANISM="Protocruzia adherens, Strain Boccale" /LENGTH=313 /DNA_ID=CAMNT_0002394151 /DNA_START=545 /DNA_END=1483 /DNA_ORIENTATION=-